MKQLEIKNRNYYYTLIGMIAVLMIHNIYFSISNKIILGILPVFIQFILLFLLLSKNRFGQNSIKLWIIIVFFVGQGIRLIGILMQALGSFLEGESFLEMLTSKKVLTSVIYVIFGVILWILNKEFGEVVNNKSTYEN